MSEHMVVDVYASHWHYLDHIEPIWHALPDQVRGDVLITNSKLRRHPLVVDADGRRYDSRTRRRVSRVLIAGAPDLSETKRNGWGIALMEHGVGQTYEGVSNLSYAGSPGRDRVGLFVCPNDRVADRNERLYRGRSVTTGCPRLDVLSDARRRQGRTQTPTLALCWHWQNMRAGPEGGWAFDQFMESMVTLRSIWPGHIIGTSHPRSWPHVLTPYRQAGIEPVERWADVVARADVLSFDNTSAGFEAAALGIPVVLCERSTWRRDVAHGLRFWEYSDIGPTVRADVDSRSLAHRWAESATDALEDENGAYARRREAMADDLFPHRGEAAKRAAAALCRWVGFRP